MEEYFKLIQSCKYFTCIRQGKEEISFNIEFLAKPGAKLSYFKVKNNQLIISVTEKPIDGEANAAFIEYISKLFHVAKSDVDIIRGQKGKFKTIELTMGEKNSRPWKKRIEDIKELLCQLEEERSV